ncbi:MAG TPA: alpha/beta hydrolase [Geobacteraceae bacterium]
MSTLQIESKTFHYGGNIPIHYQVVGHGAVPLVFLHGIASAHNTWHDLVRLFPAERFRLFLLDLKGFGLSAKPRDGAYAIEDQVDMVQAFIREQGFHSVVLVGHSYGGAVALRVCLQTQGGKGLFSIEKLVLIGCAAYPQRLPKFYRRLKNPLLGPLLLHLMPKRMMVKEALAKIFSDGSAITPERVERFVGYFRGRGILYALRTTVNRIDLEAHARVAERYRELSVPTLIIWGEEDYIVKLKHGRRLHGDIAGSRLKVVGKCGHLPHEERPAETFATMDEFLATM